MGSEDGTVRPAFRTYFSRKLTQHDTDQSTLRKPKEKTAQAATGLSRPWHLHERPLSEPLRAGAPRAARAASTAPPGPRARSLRTVRSRRPPPSRRRRPWRPLLQAAPRRLPPLLGPRPLARPTPPMSRRSRLRLPLQMRSPTWPTKAQRSVDGQVPPQPPPKVETVRLGAVRPEDRRGWRWEP